MRADYGPPTTLRLEPKVHDRVRELAREMGATESETLRRAVRLGVRVLRRRRVDAAREQAPS